jgi:hypothetical protein
LSTTWCAQEIAFDGIDHEYRAQPEWVTQRHSHKIAYVHISSKKAPKSRFFPLTAKWSELRGAAKSEGLACPVAERADTHLSERNVAERTPLSPSAAPPGDSLETGDEPLDDQHPDVIGVVAMMHFVSRKVRAVARGFSLEAIAAPSEELCWPKVRSMTMTVAANYPDQARDLARLCERATEGVDRFFTQRSRYTVDDAYATLVAFADYLETLPDLRSVRAG